MRHAQASISNRWTILLVLFIARTMVAVQFQTVGSAAPFLMKAFGIDFAGLGTLIGLFMLPGIFLALPGGMLGQRFGAERMTLVGLALMVAGGVLTALSASVAWFAMGRLISGAGAALLNVLLTKMVADWFAGREIVTAMAVLVASWPLGLALGLLLFTPLAAAQSWHAVMFAAALMAAASLALIATLYREPAGLAAGKRRASLRPGFDRREWLAVSLAGVVWAAYNVGLIVLISFVPALLTARGYSLVQAGLIASVLGWTLIPCAPLAGYLAQRLRKPDWFMIGGFAIAGTAAAAMPFAGAPLVPFAVLALAIGAPAGAIMALPAAALRAENWASGLGIYFTWYYLGMAVLPGAAGMARDITMSVAAPALFAAAMMAVALGGLLGFRAVCRH